MNHFFLNAFLVEYEFQAFDPLIFKYGADLMFFSVCLCHSDFRLHFQMKQQNAIQYLSVLWDPLNPTFTSHSPHQFTHEEVSVSGLWLSLERSADGFLALQFSLDLSRECIQVTLLIAEFHSWNSWYLHWRSMDLQIKISGGRAEEGSLLSPSCSKYPVNTWA